MPPSPSFGSLDVGGGTLTIPVDASWTVPASAEVNVAGAGKLQNMNLITNQGTISGAGTVDNLGTIVNTGNVTVNAVTGHSYVFS